MDERADRGEFYPGGSRSEVPPGTSTDKVDRVNLGEVGESYTLKEVKNKVNQIVRAIAPVAVCLAICAQAATAPLEDLPNTAPVVTNEEDVVAMAAVGALGGAVSNKVDVEVAGVHARIDSATNALELTGKAAILAATNEIAATYAKLADIPAQPDLSPYALKSELPKDYLTEGDITNFATRAWINSQNYAREGTVYTRLDAQDLAIDAATNRLWAAHLAEAARLNAASNALDSAWRAGTNTVMQTVESESNRLDSATNEVWQSALRADETLQREIDALRIVAADSNAVTRLVTADGSTWQDATGVVWQVSEIYGWRGTALDLTNTTERTVQFNPVPGTNEVWSAGVGTNLVYDAIGMSSYCIIIADEYVYADDYPPQSATNLTITTEYEKYDLCYGVVALSTNAVDRVLHESDNIAADLTPATNYTDAIAAAFENGDRSVQYANNSGHTDYAVQLYNEDASGLYNASDLIRASTNAAKAVAGPVAVAATNYTDAVAADIRQSYIPIDGGPIYSTVELFLNSLLHEQGMLLLELPSGGSVDAAAFVGSTQITNQGAVAVAEGLAARKQDALPYPTNAIPYAAIDGAPSGGGTPEWRVVQIDENTRVSFVTNGIAAKLINGELYATTNGWPDGAAMFVRGSVVIPQYEVDEQIRLVGYGTWPTNSFQSVWWRSGATIYVNILVEE